MKHLKLFESANPYYEKISSEEFDFSDMIGMSESNIRKIENLKTQKGVVRRLFRYPFDFFEFVASDCSEELNVYEREDEWFYVLAASRIDDSPSDYYRCDQFEGLVRLLKDLKVI